MDVADLHVEVSGMVQGVGFRWFTVQAARRLGVGGWVRNRADGTVEIVASGTQADLDRFLMVVRRGPSGARVERVRSLPVDAASSDAAAPFELRR
ncbi:MAG TPA: acylphosphatase [Gemmatimonadaceae bacterium]|nr:acylphosphatase [Gemmatimonadaceae bacterium]